MTLAPKTAAALAIVLGSSLTLAACGGDAEVSEEPGGSATEIVAAPVPGESTPPAIDATPPPTDSASVSPSVGPSPSPTATPTAAAETPAVAAKPPEFPVCAACHSTEPGRNGIGPTLAGVYGAKAGHIDDFDYSEALENSGLTWNETNLDRYLADPRGVIPGTKMAYPGLKDAAKRKAMVDYLKTL